MHLEKSFKPSLLSPFMDKHEGRPVSWTLLGLSKTQKMYLSTYLRDQNINQRLTFLKFSLGSSKNLIVHPKILHKHQFIILQFVFYIGTRNNLKLDFYIHAIKSDFYVMLYHNKLWHYLSIPTDFPVVNSFLS